MRQNKTMSKAKKKEAKSNIPTAAELEGRLEIVKASEAAPVAAVREARTLSSVFAPSEQDRKGKITRLSLPPIVKPSEVVPGVTIMGTVLRVIPSPMKQYKSNLLVMSHPNGQFCWPLNAVTKRALVRYQGGEGDETLDVKKLEGLKLIISGLGTTKTQDGLRTVKLFDIGVVE